MKSHILKTELKRAFHGWGMKLAILLAFALAVAEFFSTTLKSTNNLYALYPDGDWGVPYSLWDSWLGGEMLSLPSYLYRLLLPFFAALPFSSSYAHDVQSGYLRQLLVRADKKKYLKAKLFSVWLSGGVATVLPMIFSFLLATAVLPLRGPNRMVNFVIGSRQLFGELYPHSPLLYLLCFLALIFLFSGIVAFVALFVSLYVSNSFIVLISPFALWLMMDITIGKFPLKNDVLLSPMQYLHPAQWVHSSYIIVIVEMILFFVIFGMGFYLVSRNRDTI